ncbi:CheW protein [Solidesulfovibrio carbinoliphilus subsp. oakridgensis]|uniref:CheW protein n=1 Tax=Solidesulfovibrio carbinoliphilus subsp. oakridgensis TaxID=694327 RepID=G7Q6D1_9BACT|nr:chemotaxis protein CheW [Solidesulfovibrio carbinoliphilus]EHJ47304.1 CheW protein [Solidesulfovibrio carbinoliphilus subsp. oakridgensis]
MSPSLEEYFKDTVVLPEPGPGRGTFTEAERDFLTRYMGADFETALTRQGLSRPAAVESVTGPLSTGPAAAPPGRSAPPAATSQAAPATGTNGTGPAAGEDPARRAGAGQAGIADAAPALATAEDGDAALEAGLREAREVKLVGFRVAGQELALPIAQVQEVLRAVPVTRLPTAPPHIVGILNLRGRVVPMVDLAEIMDFSGQRGEKRFVIVCRCRGMLVGLMVEALTTMHQADGQAIEWGVEARIGVASDLVSGLLKVGDALVAILSVDSLFQKVLKS